MRPRASRTTHRRDARARSGVDWGPRDDACARSRDAIRILTDVTKVPNSSEGIDEGPPRVIKSHNETRTREEAIP